ncbi:MAG: type IV pilus modification protein PilV [Pseudohongiellaceae bacterium]
MNINTTLQKRMMGFTLIEVLVALLILGIGLLGVAGLQFRGMQYSKAALIRSEASLLVYEITDKIRANSENVDDYLGDWTVPTAPPTGCNPALAANSANDLICWRQGVFGALPPGSEANITSDGTLYTVTIIWDDRDGNGHTVSYTFM